MATPHYTISLVASPIGGTVGLQPGDGMVFSPTSQSYVLATAAARSGVRTSGFAVGHANVNGAVAMQTVGDIPPAISGLSAGFPSWVRVDDAGRMERCSPESDDDIVGFAEADGTVHLMCGAISAQMVNALAIGGELGGTPDYPIVEKLSTTQPVKWKGPAQLGELDAADVFCDFGVTPITPGTHSLYLYDTTGKDDGFYRIDVVVSMTVSPSKAADFTIRLRVKRSGTTLAVVGGGSDPSPYNPEGWTCELDVDGQDIILSVSGDAFVNTRVNYEIRVGRTDF